MEHHEQYRDNNMSSPHSYSDSQWGPPPQFQDHDHIQPVGSPPQSFSPGANSPLTNSVHAHSPPAQTMTPIHDYTQQGYQEGYVHLVWSFHDDDASTPRNGMLGLLNSTMTRAYHFIVILLKKKRLIPHTMLLGLQLPTTQDHKSYQDSLPTILMAAAQCLLQRMEARQWCHHTCDRTDSRSMSIQTIITTSMALCLHQCHQKMIEGAA